MLRNAASSTITVTSTATTLPALIDTAGGVSNNLPGDLSAVDINAETGDIRVLVDSNTPTASIGYLVKQGTTHRFRGMPLKNVTLISVSGSNVTASVIVGRAEPGDAANNSSLNTAGSTTNITTGTLTTGAKSSIGTSAVQLTASSVSANKGVTVKAANANSGTVYVGISTVTAGTTDATDGMELGPGESITVEVSNANLLYVIGSATGQKVFWTAV